MTPSDLRQWRIDHPVSGRPMPQTQLAQLLNVTPLTIKRWEGGSVEAHWQILALALEALHARFAVKSAG